VILMLKTVCFLASAAALGLALLWFGTRIKPQCEQ
jgi:hypothetical protein